MVMHPKVRAALTQRELDFWSLLEKVTVLVLVIHGRSDTVALPAMSDFMIKQCKTAHASWFEGVGHAPFLEDPARFDTELRKFVTTAYH